MNKKHFEVFVTNKNTKETKRHDSFSVFKAAKKAFKSYIKEFEESTYLIEIHKFGFDSVFNSHFYEEIIKSTDPSRIEVRWHLAGL